MNILLDANLSTPQASQNPSMGGYPPVPVPGGYPAAPHAGGYGASHTPNQQSCGLYPQPGAPQPQAPGMGYPGQPGQPMPGYPGAPSPNPTMPGYGGAPAPTPGYTNAPSPNPPMPGYGGGAMPIAPPINVGAKINITIFIIISVDKKKKLCIFALFCSREDSGAQSRNILVLTHWKM